MGKTGKGIATSSTLTLFDESVPTGNTMLHLYWLCFYTRLKVAERKKLCPRQFDDVSVDGIFHLDTKWTISLHSGWQD